MTHFTAIYDACVIFPVTLRNLLMYLALTDLYRAKWSETIQEEFIQSVLKNRPDIPESYLQTTKDLMNKNVRDALVKDYEPFIPGLTLPDENDRHVLACWPGWK